MTQTDLERVLAYSTISQLGYMFLALGCGLRSQNLVLLAVYGGDLSSVHARLLQGPAVPRRPAA